MVNIMSHLMFGMLCEFQCIWRTKFDTSPQVMVLKLLIEICQETNTRKQTIANIFFDKVKYVFEFYNFTYAYF